MSIITRPTSEIECAELCGYSYTNKNIISYELLEDQKNHIIEKHGNIATTPPQCGCRVKNGRKCYDDTCTNRANNISCGAACSSRCHNRPWESEDHGFAAGRKTYLVMDANKGAGLYALEDIQVGAFIAEYTGRVHPSTYRFTEKQTTYTMTIQDMKQTIVGLGVCSMASRINHSCVANCKAYTYIHDGRYKNIIMADKRIPRGTEFTLNYGWTYKKGKENTRMRCYCQLGGMHYIETLDESADEPESPPRGNRHTLNDVDASQPRFNRVIQNAAMENEIALSVQPGPRPMGYYETHVFHVRDEVFIISAHQQRALQPVGGRVIQCYFNAANIAIIVVRTIIGGIQNQHVPRWLCFRYAADAAFRLQRLSEGDRKRVIAYTDNIATYKKALVLKDRLVTDYITLWDADELPYIKQVANVLESGQGGTAIGILPNVLVEQNEQTESTGTSDQNDDNENQDGAAHYSGRHIIPSPPISKRYHRRMVIESSSDEAREEGQDVENMDTQEQEESEEIISPLQQYDNTFRRNFDELRNEVENGLTFHRTLQVAIETVTFFALSRIPKERRITYYAMMTTVRRELEYFYLLAPIRDRHFLRFSHYHQAIEDEHPGSWQLRWCSLCRLSNSFASEQDIRSHFNKYHSIISGTYSCPRCKQYFVLPSEILAHIGQCCPLYAATLVSTVGSHILDAYADYNASKVCGNKPIYTIKPGLPYRHQCSIPKNSVVLPMDRLNGRPENTQIQMHPTKMTLKTKYKTVMESWDAVKFKIKKKAAPILRLRNLFERGPLQEFHGTKMHGTETHLAPETHGERIAVNGIVVDNQIAGSSRQIVGGTTRLPTTAVRKCKNINNVPDTTGTLASNSRLQDSPVSHKTRSRTTTTKNPSYKETTTGESGSSDDDDSDPDFDPMSKLKKNARNPLKKSGKTDRTTRTSKKVTKAQEQREELTDDSEDSNND